MNLRLIVPLFAVATLLASTCVRADEDQERENLARLEHDIRLLQAQVRSAAVQGNTMARVQFRYDWLDQDLELMRRAVADHLDAPRQPRPVPPLKGDYRR